MNDIMSLGIHRLEKGFVVLDEPKSKSRFNRCCLRTGDIAMIYSKKLNHRCSVSCVEPNKEMFKEGEKT